MRTFLFALLFLFSCPCFGQMISLRDSLAKAFDSEPRLVAHLNGRFSLVSGRGARFQGVKVGFAFGEQLELGMSYNWLASRKRLNPLEETFSDEARFRYVAPYITFRFMFREHWRISTPVQLGIGQSYLVRNFPEEGSEKRGFGASVIYEPGMRIEYLFLKYFRVGAGVGYRLMLLNNKEINYAFTAPTFSILFGADFGKIIDDLKAVDNP